MSKRNLRRYLAALSGLSALAVTTLVPSYAFAGSATGATISQVIAQISPGGDGAFFVYVNIVPTGVPSCGTTTTGVYRFVIDPVTPAGMAQIATALSAHATGAQVDIYGTGTCSVWVDTETILYMVAH